MKKINSAFVIGLTLFFLVGCNFHEIHKAHFYRSAQLSGKEFEAAIGEYQIKTIINLRGPQQGKKWYDEERAVADRLNVLLVDIPMSAKRLPHQRDLVRLLDVFHSAPRPLLVHCQAGVDRTGEAAAIYQMLFMNKTKDESLAMLSPAYYHFESLMPAKRYFIRDVWQGEEWARTQYNPCLGQYDHYDPSTPECSNPDYKTVLTPEEDT